MNKRNLVIAITAVILILAAILTALIVSGNREEPPLTVAELLDLGEKALLDLDYEQALVYFNKVIEIEPMTPRAYTGAAEAYVALGDTDSAMAVLRRGLELLPDNAEILAMLALLEPAPEPEPAPAAAGDLVKFGGYEWRVLEVSEGKTLLLSEYVIDYRPYHGEWFEGATGEEFGTTWADCDLRGYLNGEFYESFSAGEREQIVEAKVTTNANPWFETGGGGETNDKIFILSLDEVVKYFGDSGQLANQPSGALWIDDEYNEARTAYSAIETPDGEPAGAETWWWLRSLGDYSDYSGMVEDDEGWRYRELYINNNAAYVYGGVVSVRGTRVYNGNAGVRPALWLGETAAVEAIPAPTLTPPPPPAASYDEGNIVKFGGYKWRVLEVREGKALLLSEYVLEFRHYYTGDLYVSQADEIKEKSKFAVLPMSSRTIGIGNGT
ncbi:MAG: tetratricopeptide repeat protein, partial [Lachnospiraceae bacterium]|nr:tetratricopeptide repeat protein [Lachnospiraceae bacterium]